MKEDLPDLKFDPDFEHEESYDEDGYISDAMRCSCGWRSNGYWDGADFAHDEWTKHASGWHVYVVRFPGYDCKCRVDCGETFKSIEIRRLEDELTRLKEEQQ